MEVFNRYVEDNRECFIQELRGLLRQPTIAAQKLGIEETAQMVLSMLHQIGAEARLIPVGGGAPVVYGEVGEGRRTLLIYNHYDVQPPDPLEEWKWEPFGAHIEEGILYARGAADNKGHLVARLKAIEAYQKTIGQLPLKVKFVFEGEEETGSVHLGQFVKENRDLLLGADGCLWEGSGRDISGRPLIYMGVKGILYLELRTKGAKNDLHSSWAPLVPNPVWRLVQALATLKDQDENITVDGLMDNVVEPSKAEMEFLDNIPFEEEKIKADFGLGEFLGGVKGLEALKRYLYGPTCTICGIRAGYIEEGVKTVLPNRAMVKLDFRLVPNLEPEMVMDLLQKHLNRRGFDDIEVVKLSSEHFSKSPVDAPIARVAIEATRLVYGQEAVVYPLMAGSGPMYPLTQALGIPAVSPMGLSHGRSNIHAPNENIYLEDFIQNIKYTGELIRMFAEA